MKSAYELAMERLNQQQGPAKQLNADQKARIADIEKRFDAKAAELRLTHEQRGISSPAEQAAIRAELAAELQSLEERRQREKDEVWNEPGD